MKNKLVELVNVSKSFGSTKVLDELCLEVKENEFLTLLGPSGCGKTTTLRIIGGFEKPDSGKVFFDGADITNVPANKRNLNTVFQKYALFGHMTIDEPLGALDLKLRQDMQYELMRLKEELGITFIYITHDQEEALTMSDKIIVMNKGYIQQMGTPEDIYNEPENAFVADFIGDSNIIDGIMLEDRLVEILGTKFECVDEGFGRNRPVDVVIRPEDVVLGEEGQGILDGVVTSLIFKGVHYEMEVEANGYEWLVHSTNCHPVGSKVSISVIPFNIQIMHKPESEDEKAVTIDE